MATIFYDDFSGGAVDTTKWTVYNRLSDQVNSELNCVTPANVAVSSGTLKITGRFENHTCGDTTTAAPNPRTMNYTSGHIAQTTAPFLYGTIDVRAKIAGGTGLWPCIWMLGYQWQPSQPFTANTPGANWPNGGWWECDIAEFLNGHRTLVNNALHFITANRGGSGEKSIPFDATTRFMVYRLVWTATSMKWYVDAEDGLGFVNTLTFTGVAGTDIPDTPGFLVINMAVGGSGGAPNSATFPQTTEVDYARVTNSMAITTQDGLISALGAAQKLIVAKANVTAVAGRTTSIWSGAGQPGVGSTTLGQAAAGAVSTSADVGALGFTNPGAGNSYLGGARGISAATGLIVVYDLLWVWGSGGSGWVVTTTTAQSTTAPAALTRPDVNGTNTELLLEVLATMGVGAAAPVAGYTNSAGTASRTTTAMGYNSAAIIGSMYNFPLQAGDNGVKTVQSLTLTTSMTSGTARVMIARRIAEFPCAANIGFTYDALDLGMPRVYDSASMLVAFVPNSTASGPLSMSLSLAQG